jgi:release factor glutamine methyltransferase
MSTINQALLHATRILTKYLNNQTSAHQEAMWLLNHVLHISGAQLLARRNESLTADQLRTYENLITARTTKHTPLAYLLGTVPFCDLTLAIEPPVLIPRHETEEWVWELIQAFKTYNKPLKILDMCSGSGCIALAIAYHVPQAQVLGCDNDPAALALAEKNRTRFSLQNVSFMQSDLFAGLSTQTFDCIISNPPYLATAEWHTLDADVKQWEAPHALIGGNSGLEFYHTIITHAPKFLSGALRETNLPELVLEYGYTQAESLSVLLTQNSFQAPKIKRDSFNNCRALWTTRL